MNWRFVLPLYFALSAAAFGQARAVVTAEGRHGAAPGAVSKDDVEVRVNQKPIGVNEWVPLRGEQGALELYVLIDDGEDSDLANQYSALRDFMNQQPADAHIGVAYLQNGAARIAVPVTADRERVSKALRTPLAEPGISASPYMGVSDLIKKWPAANARREILLITSGIDPWSPPDPQNPYLEKAISDAQRAGVIVHTIYFPEAGHLGHSLWRANWGQNYLSELSDQTGGEFYWQGVATPVSIAPYLKDLTQRLGNQYLLTTAELPNGARSKENLESLHVSSTRSGVSLESAARIDMRR
ncbi:MAG TPA: hypothetical protein VKB79_06150 [Bryobacteraceae bacterium]|nr:hypothetical protein [Bryobacteraceae bacterium]